MDTKPAMLLPAVGPSEEHWRKLEDLVRPHGPVCVGMARDLDRRRRALDLVGRGMTTDQALDAVADEIVVDAGACGF